MIKKIDFFEYCNNSFILFSNDRKISLEITSKVNLNDLTFFEQKKLLKSLGVEFSINFPNIFSGIKTYKINSGYLTVSNIYTNNEKFTSTVIGFDKIKSVSIAKSISEGYERLSFYRNSIQNKFPDIYEIKFNLNELKYTQLSIKKKKSLLEKNRKQINNYLKTSSGMSAHTSLSQSIINSFCEVSEKDSLNQLFINKKIPNLVSNIPNVFTKRIDKIEAKGYKINCFDISYSKSGFHLLFVLENINKDFYTGSACALNFQDAINSALSEIEIYVYGKKYFKRVEDLNKIKILSILKKSKDVNLNLKRKFSIEELVNSVGGKSYYYKENYKHKNRVIFVTRAFCID